MHKKIIRIFTRSEYRAHVEPMYRQLSIINQSQMHVYFVSMYVYKIVNHLFPYASCNIFYRNSCSRLKLQLRTRPIYFKRKSCQLSMKVVGHRIWNKIPNPIKHARTLSTFKRLLRKYLFMEDHKIVTPVYVF